MSESPCMTPVHSARTLLQRSAPIALGLVAATSLLLPGHAHADSPTPSSVAAPVVSLFMWQVQLDASTTEGGVSNDLPSAIALAQVGLTLTDSQKAALVDSLTEQAKAEGVALTAAAPAVNAPASTPAIQPAPAASDDQ